MHVHCSMLVVSLRACCLALALGLCAATPALAQARAEIENGNVVLVTGTTRKSLTSLGRDSEAILSPDQHWVIYTRSAAAAGGADDEAPVDCSALTAPDELRQVKADGSADQLLLRGQAGDEPSQSLCAFQGKQFASDGRTMYFLSPAWTTSNALHAFSFDTRTARYVMPANDFVVLSWCMGELKDALIAQQHRYFRFGGSFDWYWLFDAAGRTDLGPIGEFDSTAAIRAELDASGQCQG